jgi:hypothetical protein
MLKDSFIKTIVFLTYRESILVYLFINYTFITLNYDCSGAIYYLIISAHEPRKMVMRLGARLERLITAQQNGFHRKSVEAFVFLGCYASYVGYLPIFGTAFPS